MSIRPWRNAPLSTVSSSLTSNSMPTGSSRTVCVSAMAFCPCPSGRRGPAAGAAALVLGDVRLALFGRHPVQEDVGALERVAARLVERPHLLRVEVEMRLRDERLAVVADVAELLHDVGDVHAVVEGLPLTLAREL